MAAIKLGKRRVGLLVALASVIVGGFIVLRAQNSTSGDSPVLDADCPYFGATRAKNSPNQTAVTTDSQAQRLGSITLDVVKWLPEIPADNQGAALDANSSATIPGGSRTSGFQNLNQLPTIDRYIYSAFNQAGATPAAKTNDYEFIRRVSLDLTGRIPKPERVLSFVADSSTNKRSRLIDEYLATPEWQDKWTMYFGDLFNNSTRTQFTNRFPEGRNAFYKWIHDSLTQNKPYDQMARELIAANSADGTMAQGSYQIGALNYTVGGFVTGGPIQDVWDQQTVDVSTTFLGISHLHCLLCHNGRGHLDALSLWGANGTRFQAWQMASFLSHTDSQRIPVGDVSNHDYWTVRDDTRFRTDYPLNTTTGNRPARQATNGVNRVAPVYWFSGKSPASGEDYRVAFAREVTADPQFARAAVNYIWKEFFGVGLVDPVDQFDPARLDPDNPPPAPWSLQASNPRLLNSLAQDFINGKFDLKALMRQIANSNAYQLSARYNGDWNPAWASLYARKLVRRLWAEEIHDSIAQVSGIIPSYTIRSATSTFGPVNYAMQFPETDGTPDNNGPVSNFLNAFLRGNRVDEDRSGEGSLSQALGLMNDNFVMTRIRASGSGATASLLARNINLPDDQLVNNLYLTVLSRPPSDAEMTAALANLKTGVRSQQAENLLWTLYNKVDFIYNY